jgi:hypothetical protein
MLRDARVPYRVIDVPDRAAQNALIEQWNARAFPLVLVEGEYVGGFTHVLRLHSQGRLRTIVSADGEIPADDAQPSDTLPARPRLDSSTHLSSKPPSSGMMPVSQPAGSLADYARLGEYLQRTKKV